MTEAGKVDLGQPQNPGSPYTHMLVDPQNWVRIYGSGGRLA